jgi:uncharacterized membrane protein
MRKLRFILAALCLFCFVLPTLADKGGYVIDRFDVELDIRSDSSLIVTEKLVVLFSEPRHGIYRSIPVRYTDPKGFQYGLGFELLGVTAEDGSKCETKVSNKGAYISIRIGSPSSTVNGRVVYQVMYRITDALRHLAEHDELYWNATGTEWRAGIRNATATVHLPGLVDDEDLQTSGYTGRFGSTERAVTTERTYIGAILFTATRPFRPQEGLTVAVGWPHGLVQFPGPVAKSARFFSHNLALLAPFLAGGWLYRRYRKQGKDPEGPGSVVVRYEPPAGLKPAEIGTIVDEKVDFRDITATMIDLAVRGWMRIEVEKKEQLFGLISTEETVFHLLRTEAGDELLPYEKKILNGIFCDGTDRMEASDLANKFYKTIPKVTESLYNRLTERGHFAGNPSQVRTRYVLAGLGAGVAVFLLGALWAAKGGGIMPYSLIASAVAGILTFALFVSFARAMPRRTRKGVAAWAWALGFEEFTGRVEVDNLEMDRQRNIFESLLPYAMALGVAEKWARQFEGIYATGGTPGWYVGSGSPHAGFSTTSFQRSLQSSMTQAAQSMKTSPRSSGSSGSGGGGSSGGGGGGGGGGSW